MSRTVSLRLIDRVKIAAPCPMKWEDMAGDDKRRFCHHCQLHVHNFSAMTEDEAENLLREHFGSQLEKPEARLCGGWYKRADGTALLQDCPVGLGIKRRVKSAVVALATLSGVTVILGLLLARVERDMPDVDARYLYPVFKLRGWLRPPEILGGVICPVPEPSDAPAPAGDAPSDSTPPQRG